ncbi:MAG: amidohydrolase family protein [Gemmatimonadaceae bacterium]|nr:amidohydrolase family protein [Gemmatimonadaceae bacterium]
MRSGISERVRLVVIDSMATAPRTVWLDARGRLFTSGIDWFGPVRPGWESTIPALRATEYAFHARRSAALAARLAPPTTTALAIRRATLFDSETGVVRPGTTVIVTGDRITAVGPDASTTIPRGARVIDANGKALLPGLWDMHVHLDMAFESDGVLQLAAGITTVRDMAADMDNALSVRRRAAEGTLLAPRVLLAGFIEGPGFWAGPSDALVHTEADARALVARYDSLGYRQIKLYNLVHPDLVPVIAAEAKARGLRLSGHIPRGLSLQAAVQLGFDEVQHGAFLFSTFFQDSLYVPRMRAYSNLAAEVAPTFDLEAQRFTDLLTFLKARGTVYDGTFNVYEDASCLLPDGTHPVLGPAMQWLPPLEQRGPTRALCDSTSGPQRLQAKYHRALARLHAADVTLVPGTDNYPGLSYHGELEIYERAGVPATEVLRMATIVPARVMREEGNHGSIAVGKVADLVLVDGAPWQRIRDLRRTHTVVRSGRDYNVDALYRAVGVMRK